MTLRMHNTLSGAIEPVAGTRDGEVGLYVCGVTVYDRCHVGHARSIERLIPSTAASVRYSR